MGILENVTSDLSATQERIISFSDNCIFSPLAALTGKETPAQKIYRIDCNFLHELELLIEKHRKDINAAALGR